MAANLSAWMFSILLSEADFTKHRKGHSSLRRSNDPWPAEAENGTGTAIFALTGVILLALSRMLQCSIKLRAPVE